MASIQCGQCKGVHSSVAEVKVCHGIDLQSHGAVQYSYSAAGLAARGKEFDVRTEQHASEDAIETAMTAGEAAATADADVKPQHEGFYKHDDIVYKVVRSQKGWLYVQRLGPKEDHDYIDVESAWKWHYSPGAMKFLRASDEMSKEDAQAFGRISGVCCVCGRRLTNPESIRDGIGPVCGGKW